MSDFTPTTGNVRAAYERDIVGRGANTSEGAIAEFDRWLMAIIEQSRELERQQSRDYATKRREEACALIKATGHAPNDVMEDEFKVNVKLGYYEAWEIEREIDGHPVVEDGRVKRHRIKEDIPEGFNIVYLA